MQNELENFYLNQPEPNQSCFLALRDIILASDTHFESAWKYKLPFFLYRGKMCCYLWKDKKTQEPYVSFAGGQNMNHAALESGSRTRFKIFRINPNHDIDIQTLNDLLDSAKTVIDAKLNK